MKKVFGQKTYELRKKSKSLKECKEKCIAFLITQEESSETCKEMHRQLYEDKIPYSNCPGLYVEGIIFLKIRRF